MTMSATYCLSPNQLVEDNLELEGDVTLLFDVLQHANG